MILARGLRLQNSTEFRHGTKIQAKKPDVGRDQHLAAQQIFYSSHYMISQWPKNDRFPFVSCTNNVMQHIDKLSLPVRYVIKVNTSDTLSLNKSHFFFLQFWTKNRKSCYRIARLTSNVNTIQGKSFECKAPTSLSVSSKRKL